MDAKDISLIEPYCRNGMSKLKSMSNSILRQLNDSISGADYNDFYSLANLTLWQAYNSYNPALSSSFNSYLYGCIVRKFKQEIRDRHRFKRVGNLIALPLDAPIQHDNGSRFYIAEVIPSDFDTFKEAVHEDYVSEYISHLSALQTRILDLLLDGYTPGEIRSILKISVRTYFNQLSEMQSFENIKYLRGATS